MKAFKIWLFLGLISACSSDNSPPDGGADATSDVTTQKDVAIDTKAPDTGTDAPADVVAADVAKDAPADVTTSDASDAGTTMYTLTINDYLNWCAVSVNGGDASTADPQTFQFAPDASVGLHGDTANASLFYWGYWKSANIGDGGPYASKDASVTMNGNVSVQACCPVNNTTTPCP
jgi:hypothetical protein